MSIPSSMSQLSTLEPDNYPKGSDSLSVVDDHIRAIGAIVKRGASIKTAGFSSGTISIGLESGSYEVNATANITSITGGFADGVFTLIFTNVSPVTLSNSSTITTASTLTVKQHDQITLKRAGNGVFSVIGVSTSQSVDDLTRDLDEYKDDVESAFASTGNSITYLNTELSKRNSIVWGFTDGSGHYGDNWVSNLQNQLLHTTIDIPVGVWEVTGYGAMVASSDVHMSVPIQIIRRVFGTTNINGVDVPFETGGDSIGVSSPAVFFNMSGKGGIYYPAHFKAIINNTTGSTQRYRLKTGAGQVSQNAQASGLFGSSIGET